MQASDTITIHLAGQAYVIHPFTVGQLEELHVGVVLPESADPKENVRQLWKRNVDVIAAALSQDHPQITRDVIVKMRLGSVKAVNETSNQILRFAGIIKEETQESPPGEAQAAA